jgi:hypothetical protein
MQHNGIRKRMTTQSESDFKLPMSEFLYIGMIDPNLRKMVRINPAWFPKMKREFVAAI